MRSASIRMSSPTASSPSADSESITQASYVTHDPSLEGTNQSPTVIGSVEETKDLTQFHPTLLSAEHGKPSGSVDDTLREKAEGSHSWRTTLVRFFPFDMLLKACHFRCESDTSLTVMCASPDPFWTALWDLLHVALHIEHRSIVGHPYGFESRVS